LEKVNRNLSSDQAMSSTGPPPQIFPLSLHDPALVVSTIITGIDIVPPENAILGGQARRRTKLSSVPIDENHSMSEINLGEGNQGTTVS
jgi:hypothetical protein